LVKDFYPRALEIRETFGGKNTIQSIPDDRVKSLAEVKVKNRCRCGPTVASLNNISSVNKVLRNSVPRDEVGLVRVDKEGDEAMKAKRETF
jgi:hypothetical protein